MTGFPRALLVVLSLGVAGCAGTATAPGPATPQGPFNVLGREDAPVAIIEFSDLQCPHCARFAAETFPRLRSEFIETGKLRYAARDLPLPFHAFATPAAVATRCAGEQGRFWEYREALFANQERLGLEPYAEVASALGLDVAQLEACRSDGRQAAEVRADLELARSFGIASTPTFVVGRVVDGKFQGELISGAQPYEVFAARIAALLEPAR
jgi:protein-disulfide isomerase